MEVLREAGLDGHLVGILDHQAGDGMVARERLVRGKLEHRAAAALAGLDLEFALGGWPHDEILQKAVRGDAGLELGIGGSIAMPADIAGRLNELVEGDRLDHGLVS